MEKSIFKFKKLRITIMMDCEDIDKVPINLKADYAPVEPIGEQEDEVI